MSYSWYRTGTCTTTSGSARVNFQNANITTAATKPVVGDAFTIDNSDLYEVIFIGSDATGEYVMLDRNFEQASASNAKYAFMRLASSTQNAKLVAQAAEAINQKQISLEDMHEWYTLQSDEVEFTQVDGTIVKIPTWYKFNNDLGAVGPHLPDIETVADNIDAVKAAPAAAQTATEKAAIATTKAAEADASEKAAAISAGNAAASTILMSEQEARAINRINEAKYDASGMVNTGKHKSSGTAINEGMYLEPTIPNTIGMGRLRSGDKTGTSKTDFAVTHIAGAISNLLGVSEYSADNGLYFKLPEAEDGTRIYDSTGDARGSGQASLDLKVDADPKYGDVAADTNEAVARAFEGDAKNGNFRLGDNGDWLKESPSSVIITTDGAIVDGTQTALSSLYQLESKVAGDKYRIEMVVSEVTAGGIRLLFDNSDISNVYHTEAGRYETTVTVSASGGSIAGVRYNSDFIGKVDYISITHVTEEVVTHPVDLVGLEYYEEELTGLQEVFECIQSLSTTFGDTGVPTVLSTRKLSYFQQYDGQFPEVTADPDKINDRYRCVVWTNLTDEQKRKVAAYMGEKLFIGVNGNIVNGRLRALTERSAGNGDWLNISSLSGTLQYDANSKVKPRGDQDIATTGQYDHDPMNKGVFKSSNASVAYQGRCYLYVIGQRA
ncbi:hypothetical protein VPHK250G1_0009 [Vibrio phage K250 g1]